MHMKGLPTAQAVAQGVLPAVLIVTGIIIALKMPYKSDNKRKRRKDGRSRY